MEYTYADVIIDPNDPRVEIGAEYYWGASPRDTIDRANNKGGALPLFLIDREKEHTFPFYFCQGSLEGGSHFLIRKKAYVEKQAEWIKTNDIKAGDKVRIIREFYDSEDSFSYIFHFPEMKRLIGKICEICSLWTDGIKVFNEDKSFTWIWPFFCLEKVEEPEFKVGDFVKEKETRLVGVITEKTEDEFAVYQNCPNTVLLFEAEELEPVKAHLEPFNLNDKKDRDMLRGKWISPKDEEFMDECMITGFHSFEKGKVSLCLAGNGYLSPEDALSLWCFLDGSPCGIVVEDE